MSLCKSFQSSRKLKLQSMFSNQTSNILMDSFAEILSPISGNILNSIENSKETSFEPNSSSTTTSSTSNISKFKGLTISSVPLKKSSFKPKNLLEGKENQNTSNGGFKNMGFGSLGDDFEEKFELLDVLGKGHQGTVLKAKELKTGKLYAAKINNQKDDELDMNLKSEFCILSTLNHPNILQAKELIDTPKSSIMIMEYLNLYIPLQDYIDENFPLSSITITSIFSQMGSAVSYLHDHKIIHRDLHISNVLINPETLNVKIIDFGLSKRIYYCNKSFDSLLDVPSKLQQDESIDLNTPTGLPSFRAPELLSHGSYSFKIDIWMLGLILYALINKEYLTTMTVLKKMKMDDKFGNKDLTKEIKICLIGCLRRSPNERLNAKDIVSLMNKD